MTDISHERSKMHTLRGCVKSFNRYTTGKAYKVSKGDTIEGEGGTSGFPNDVTGI